MRCELEPGPPAAGGEGAGASGGEMGGWRTGHCLPRTVLQQMPTEQRCPSPGLRRDRGHVLTGAHAVWEEAVPRDAHGCGGRRLPDTDEGSGVRGLAWPRADS